EEQHRDVGPRLSRQFILGGEAGRGAFGGRACLGGRRGGDGEPGEVSGQRRLAGGTSTTLAAHVAGGGAGGPAVGRADRLHERTLLLAFLGAAPQVERRPRAVAAGHRPRGDHHKRPHADHAATDHHASGKGGAGVSTWGSTARRANRTSRWRGPRTAPPAPS